MNPRDKLWVFLSLSLCLALPLSCGEKEPGPTDVPDTYQFFRNGESTVEYREPFLILRMLEEISDYMKRGDAGEEIEYQRLYDMLSNTNAPFEDSTLNASGIEPQDLTRPQMIGLIRFYFSEASTLSKQETLAQANQAGKIRRSGGENIHVTALGHECTQMVEKSLMGALIFHQLMNSVLTEDKIGDQVNNHYLVAGKAYTPLEHHWDRAFGYLGIARTFPSISDFSENGFWRTQIYEREALLGTLSTLKAAFLSGRTAIVNKEHEIKWQQANRIKETLELVSAASAVHFINNALEALDQGEQGELFHHLTQAYGLVDAVKHYDQRALSDDQREGILYQNFGNNANFWTVTREGLLQAKATLNQTYPELEAVIDLL